MAYKQHIVHRTQWCCSCLQKMEKLKLELAGQNTALLSLNFLSTTARKLPVIFAGKEPLPKSVLWSLQAGTIFYREQFVLFQLVTRAVVLLRPVLRKVCYNNTSSLCLVYAVVSSYLLIHADYQYICSISFRHWICQYTEHHKNVGVWRVLLGAKWGSSQRSWLIPLPSDCSYGCSMSGETLQGLHSFFQALTLSKAYIFLGVTQNLNNRTRKKNSPLPITHHIFSLLLKLLVSGKCLLSGDRAPTQSLEDFFLVAIPDFSSSGLRCLSRRREWLMLSG